MTVLVFAPNWLGDVVMALPALADVRRHVGGARLVVAARASVAGVWPCVPGVDGVVTFERRPGSGTLTRIAEDVRLVKAVGADLAILLPNSFHSALVAFRAGIADRRGYRGDGRGWLLTRAVARPREAVHQVDYYRRLVAALGITNGDREPRLAVPAGALDAARGLLAEAGWTPGVPLVGMAPGAAYGGAKRWPPERFAEIARRLSQARQAACVVLGSAHDAATAWAIERELGKIGGGTSASRVFNLVGRTDLPQLAGVLAQCAAFLSNDSGAMHLAAAVGVPVVALFGPTDERATAPVASRVTVLSAPVWCRPCMLRECPLDHRCMTGIGVDAVAAAIGDVL
ncbi:MAG: lipopolysaccharide heptosyltransferase II [Acidobacteria bacterium]|nr:lipopolysaccharide heptosyltransferase II [Acidobacteriota bacterium]